MKHGKITVSKGNIIRFLADHFAELILGACYLVGLLIGLLGSFGQADIFCLFAGGDSFFRFLSNTLFPLTVFFFLAFFSGTSPLGMLSPLFLILFGLYSGRSVALFTAAHAYWQYLLFACPVLVLSVSLLIKQLQEGISLSMRLFQLCIGGGAADLSIRFKAFLLRCLIGFSAVAAGCVLVSGIRFYLFAV